MAEPRLIVSDLSQEVREDDVTSTMEIYRLKDVPRRTLEVVDEDGTSTAWDKEFDSDRAAFEEAVRAIREEGVAAFRDQTDGVGLRRAE